MHANEFSVNKHLLLFSCGGVLLCIVLSALEMLRNYFRYDPEVIRIFVYDSTGDIDEWKYRETMMVQQNILRLFSVNE